MIKPLLEAERYVTGSSQYLVVHKCGTGTIQKSIGTHVAVPSGDMADIVSWTCYRDPVDRFKSGLYYDLCVSGMGAAYYKDAETLFRRVLEDDQTYRVFRPADEARKKTGRIPHTIAQSAYWLGRRIDAFVPIEQLSDFLVLHYGQCNTSNELVKDDDYYRFMKMAEKYDARIAAAHELDYRLISQIQPWRWEYGKLF